MRIKHDKYQHQTTSAEQSKKANVEQTTTPDDFDDYMMEENEHRTRENPYDDIQQDELAADHDVVLTNTPKSQMAFLYNFVDNIEQQLQDKSIRSFSMTAEELAAKHADPTIHIDINDIDLKRDQLAVIVAVLNTKQRLAYDKATSHINGSNTEQLVMFVSGEGGTGKSKFIEAISLYTHILHGKTEGRRGAVLKTAPTGGAAYNIRGSTWQKALGKTTLRRLKRRTELRESEIQKLQTDLKGTQLFILDECSLISNEDLYEMSLRIATGTQVWFHKYKTHSSIQHLKILIIKIKNPRPGNC